LNVAVPLFKVPVPTLVPFARKATVPVGVPLVAVTVAVSVTFVFTTICGAEVCTELWERVPIACWRVCDLEAAKASEFPVYTAVIE
jgi:hypothetical protein